MSRAYPMHATIVIDGEEGPIPLPIPFERLKLSVQVAHATDAKLRLHYVDDTVDEYDVAALTSINDLPLKVAQ